uniref:Uncharacterized protein n=1 Tax=Rhizophora mucronata TaxID=61149 RepID=A0A2P2P7B6_RHIMU
MVLSSKASMREGIASRSSR